MNLIAKYLEKDPENAEIELPTSRTQTSRLERLRQDQWRTQYTANTAMAVPETLEKY